KAITVTDTAANTDVTIQNTTAATSGTSQSSPLVSIAGNYWTGAASATDSWTLQTVETNGTNGNSNLTLVHSGSTGTAAFAIGTPGGGVGYTLRLAGTTADSTMTQTGSFTHAVGSSASWSLTGSSQSFSFQGTSNSTSVTTGISLVPQAGLLTVHGNAFF